VELEFARIARTPATAPLTRFFVYSGAGLIGTAMHFVVLFIALSYIGPVLASSLGAIVGCLVNYSLARNFVFFSTTSFNRSFPRFAAVALLGIGINALVINALVGSFHVLVSQVIASSAVLAFGYAANKRWTFNDS